VACSKIGPKNPADPETNAAALVNVVAMPGDPIRLPFSLSSTVCTSPLRTVMREVAPLRFEHSLATVPCKGTLLDDMMGTLEGQRHGKAVKEGWSVASHRKLR
jgi:hypothetical protein